MSLSGVGVTLGARPLFADVSLRLTAGSRVALVGGNGVGKTTLLRVLIGELEPDTGTVSRPKGTRIGWLPQDVVDGVSASGTVLDAVLEGARDVLALQAELTRLEGRLADAGGGSSDELLARYASVQDRFVALGGYELEAEAHRTLAGLGFAPEDGQREVRELSGGWRVRLALARLLLSHPDVLVLDEPTNHLDLPTIAWLESTLRALSGSLVFVSHDRDFIDAVAERIVELAAGTATVYDVRSGTTAAQEGGFAAFVAQREQRLAQLRAARANQDRRIAETERFVERFRYKASKARLVQSRIKSLDKLERIEVPDHRALVARFGFPDPPRSPRVVAELEGVAVRFPAGGVGPGGSPSGVGPGGSPVEGGTSVVLDDVDLAVERGRTVAVVGPNGAGKTTLLRLLTGELAPTAGTVTLGSNVEVAVVDQHQAERLDLDATVLEEFRSALVASHSGRDISDRHRGRNHRTMLGAFGFPGDLADRRVGALSGGERTRLGLAQAMASPVNLLLLDEPTNHLDLASRDVLEDAIDAYPGTILLVTHDRHVIRATADAVVEVDGGRARWFDGTYEELLARREDQGLPAASGRTVPAAGAGGGERATGRRRRAADRDATRGLRRDVTRYERELGEVEGEVAQLTRELADPAVYADGERTRALVARHGRAKDRAVELLDAWERAQLALEAAEA